MQSRQTTRNIFAESLPSVTYNSRPCRYNFGQRKTWIVCVVRSVSSINCDGTAKLRLFGPIHQKVPAYFWLISETTELPFVSPYCWVLLQCVHLLGSFRGLSDHGFCYFIATESSLCQIVRIIEHFLAFPRCFWLIDAARLGNSARKVFENTQNKG